MSAHAGNGESYEMKIHRTQHELADHMRLRRRKLMRACLAEFCGTAILVIFGCGVLVQAELGDQGKQAHGTFISKSLGWGLAVTLGVFFAGIGGSGHINPAVTLAFAIIGKTPWKRVLFYTIFQLAGGFFGALAVFGIYYEKISQYVHLRDNGTFLLTTTGDMFVTNPHGVTHTTCLLDQIMGTALLAACALAIVDNKGWKMPAYLHPLYLGLMVYALVGCFALNAGCALNPARDLGPRLMLLICGWGSAAFTGSHFYFWVPIIGPYLGAIIGAILYEVTIGMHLDTAGTQKEEEEAARKHVDGISLLTQT